MRFDLILLQLLLLPIPLRAEKTHKSEAVRSEEERPASDAHSFAELFSKLERELGFAAGKKDRKFVDAMLANEFIERNARDPEHTIPRGEWIENNLSEYELDPASVHSMTIRAFVGNAIVSFIQKGKSHDPGRIQGVQYLIVDVWTANHGKWQLASRFKSVALPGGPL